MNIAIIGGGAAGFFAAFNLAESLNLSKHEICIFESSNKLLSKVLISGGGRCNLTNSMISIDGFLKSYPRGEKELKQVFSRFNNLDLINWFESHGIKLKTEPDGRVFPQSNSSKTIVDFFISFCSNCGVKIKTNHKLINIDFIPAKPISQKKFLLTFTNKNEYTADYVVITTGGTSNPDNYSFLKNTSHTITPLIPSLFSFNIDRQKTHISITPEESKIYNKDSTQKPYSLDVKRFISLAGISVKNIRITLSKKHTATGDILITHNGISGPAVLKLSAFAAKELNKLKYDFPVYINWAYSHEISNLQIAIDTLKKIKQSLKKNKNVSSHPQFDIPHRLWEYLVSLSEINSETKWLNISSKQLNNLAGNIFSFKLNISGKTTNKEEFVTCGGIKLKEIDFKTMQSKLTPNLFFAGEVLDIDGITGGFNFQSAWSTAFISAKSIIKSICDL